jgi:hypothetical protein
LYWTPQYCRERVGNCQKRGTRAHTIVYTFSLSSNFWGSKSKEIVQKENSDKGTGRRDWGKKKAVPYCLSLTPIVCLL